MKETEGYGRAEGTNRVAIHPYRMGHTPVSSGIIITAHIRKIIRKRHVVGGNDSCEKDMEEHIEKEKKKEKIDVLLLPGINYFLKKD